MTYKRCGMCCVVCSLFCTKHDFFVFLCISLVDQGLLQTESDKALKADCAAALYNLARNQDNCQVPKIDFLI